MRRRLLHLSSAYGASMLALLTTVWLVKLLPAREFSLVVLGLAIGTFTSLAVDWGTARTFVRDFTRLKSTDAQSRLLHGNLARRALMMSALLFGCTAGCLCIEGDAQSAVAISALTAWATMRGMLPNAWFDLIHRTGLQNSLNLAERLVALLLIALVAWLPETWHTAFVFGSLLLAVRSLSLAAQYVVWWRCNPYRLKFRWEHCSLRGQSGTNYKVMLAFAANAVASYGTQIILRGYGSDAELASYGVAFQLMSFVLLFQSQCLRFVMTSIANACHEWHHIGRSLARNASIIGGASLALSALTAIALHMLPGLLQRSEYASLPGYAFPLCTWVVLVGVGQVVTQHVLCLHEEKHYLLVAVCGGVLAFGMGMWCIPLYGALGAAYVLLAVNSATMLANALKLAWLLRQGHSRLAPSAAREACDSVCDAEGMGQRAA